MANEDLKPPKSIELTGEMIKVTLDQLQTQLVFEESGDSRQAGSEATKVASYEIAEAFWDAVVPTLNENDPRRLMPVIREMERILKRRKKVRELLEEHRTEADRINRQNQAA